VALRIVFCGTPDFAVPTLRHLIAQPDFSIEAVITQPDRPRGRGRHLSPAPVKALAQQHSLPVRQPEKIRAPEMHDYIRRLAPDAVIIIAYGQIIPPSLIEIPRLGWINLHGSLLPKYRGAAPVQWAIIKGEKQTGLTAMRVDPGLDTGPVLLQRAMPIAPDETAPELFTRLAEAGGPLIAETLRQLSDGAIVPHPQDNSQATLAPLLKKEDGRIAWSLPAAQIYNRIRGLQPWPGAFTSFRGKTCHVWGRPSACEEPPGRPGTIFSTPSPDHSRDWLVACGERTCLRLDFVRIESRSRHSAREFASGSRLQPGEAFDP